MIHVPDLPPVGVRAAAAGRWVAQAHHLLHHHTNQEIFVAMMNGTPKAGAHPSWGLGPAMTGHAHMAHAQLLGAQTAQDLFGCVQGTAEAYLHKTGFEGRPAFQARIALDVGAASMETNGVRNLVAATQTATGDWVDVAKVFGLFCEAVSVRSPFHQVLLWALLGNKGSKRTRNGVQEWVAKAVACTAQPRASSTLCGLQLPFIADTGERAALSAWMSDTVERSFASAGAAFEAMDAQLFPKDGIETEPTGGTKVVPVLAAC
jgi:hypothetical protein